MWKRKTGRELTVTALVSPLAVAAVAITLCSLLEPKQRRSVSAVTVAGAGAAYLGGGLGVWEFPFCGVMTYLAHRGLEDYRCIGIAWVLHTIWDVVHHLYANPIVPFATLSSAGCALCDLALAGWYFAGAPSVVRDELHDGVDLAESGATVRICRHLVTQALPAV
jgi:hypothetical protein